MSGGRAAAANRQELEDNVNVQLTQIGDLQHIDSKQVVIKDYRTLADAFAGTIPNAKARGKFVCDVSTHRSIFGPPVRLDRVVWRNGWSRPLGFILKTQDVGGSIQDKLCRKVLDLEECPFPTAFFLTGAGILKQRAFVDWLCSRARRSLCRPESEWRIVRVFCGLDELVKWLNEDMPYPTAESQLGFA